MSDPHTSDAEEEHLPRPSPWPFTAAGGLSLVLFGLVTTYAFSVLGVLLFIWGIAGWIGDMRRG